MIYVLSGTYMYSALQIVCFINVGTMDGSICEKSGLETTCKITQVSFIPFTESLWSIRMCDLHCNHVHCKTRKRNYTDCSR